MQKVNKNSPAAYLMHALALSESVNSQLAAQISAQSDQQPAASLYPTTIFSIWRRLSKGESIRESSLLKILKKTGTLGVSYDPEICEEMLNFFLLPCEAERVSGQPGQWRFVEGNKETPYLANSIYLPARLDDLSFQRYEISGLRGLAQGKRLEYIPGRRDTYKKSFALWQEAVDPIWATRWILFKKKIAKNPEEASHLIQGAIRNIFNVKYDHLSRKAIIEICAQVNKLFYAKEKLSIGEYHTATPYFSDITVLTEVIRRAVSRVYKLNDLEGEATIRAVGYYVMFRFGNLMRHAFAWSYSESPAPIYQLLRPVKMIDPSHMMARFFGSINDIRGFNFIFGGGILRRTSSGRTLVLDGPAGVGKTTLALQKAAGIAAKGGLAVYFSFEESYELIAARLINFGLAAPDRYKVVDLAVEGKENFPNAQGHELTKAVIAAHRREEEEKGLLIFYSGDQDNTTFSLLDAVHEVATLAREQSFKWIAMVIDSINALMYGDQPLGASRAQMRSLIKKFERERILGILLSEEAEQECPGLVFLADTFIQVAYSNGRKVRRLEIKKCRSQNFHPGKHPFRLLQGEGVRIYPALSAILASLRPRHKSTLSEHWRIPLPTWASVECNRPVNSILEKSSVLLYGDANCRKTRCALEMALRQPDGDGARMPTGVLVLTFQTTEKRFNQEIRSKSQPSADGAVRLSDSWGQVGHRVVRWYSPGEDITPEQIISAIRDQLRTAKRKGVPIDRVIVDEIEVAERTLPKIKEQPLFWSTLVQLLGVEAITSFFVFGEGRPEVSEACKSLFLEVDYAIKMRRITEADAIADPAVNNSTLVVTAKIERYPDAIGISETLLQ